MNALENMQNWVSENNQDAAYIDFSAEELFDFLAEESDLEWQEKHINSWISELGEEKAKSVFVEIWEEYGEDYGDGDALVTSTTLAKLRGNPVPAPREVFKPLPPTKFQPQKEKGEEGVVRFETRSGGRPYTANLLSWLVDKETFAYSTVRNGNAYRWVGEIKAEGIGINRYRTPEGVIFEWEWCKGDPYSFDNGVFKIINE